MIKRCRPTIVTEFHPWAIKNNTLGEPEDYLRQLEGYGYRLAVITETEGLLDGPNTSFVMNYYRSLGIETKHLDLLARPL